MKLDSTSNGEFVPVPLEPVHHQARRRALDDDTGLALIETARKLGVRNIAVHEGLPLGQRSHEQSTCAGIGRVAKRFPDATFLVYPSGFVAGAPEGPWDPAGARMCLSRRAS